MVVRTRTTTNTTDDGAGQEGSKQLPEHLSSSHYLLNLTLALDVITIERAMRARATTKPWMRADVRALRICGLPMMAVLSAFALLRAGTRNDDQLTSRVAH